MRRTKNGYDVGAIVGTIFAATLGVGIIMFEMLVPIFLVYAAWHFVVKYW